MFKRLLYAKEKKTPITILSPNDVVQLEHFQLREEEDDLSSLWYVIAHVEDGNYVFIDFSEEGSGRCYMDMQALSGEGSMLTRNFTEFLLSLCGAEGDYCYWKGNI